MDRGQYARKEGVNPRWDHPAEHGLVPAEAPGGEPLCEMAVLSVGSRRLPGISYDVFTLQVFQSLLTIFQTAWVDSERWVIPGSRLRSNR
jgi:hypothetical protein